MADADLSTQTEYLTVGEAAAQVRLSPSAIYRALEAGGLTGFKVCGRWRIQVSDLRDWVESGRNGPTQTDSGDPMPRVGQMPARFRDLVTEAIEVGN